MENNDYGAEYVLECTEKQLESIQNLLGQLEKEMRETIDKTSDKYHNLAVEYVRISSVYKNLFAEYLKNVVEDKKTSVAFQKDRQNEALEIRRLTLEEDRLKHEKDIAEKRFDLDEKKHIEELEMRNKELDSKTSVLMDELAYNAGASAVKSVCEFALGIAGLFVGVNRFNKTLKFKKDWYTLGMDHEKDGSLCSRVFQEIRSEKDFTFKD